jgi:hypothetical protein
MAVEVERGADRRLPEASLRYLRMHSGEEELRRLAVAKAVQPDPRKVPAGPREEPRKLALDGAAERGGEER